MRFLVLASLLVVGCKNGPDDTDDTDQTADCLTGKYILGELILNDTGDLPDTAGQAFEPIEVAELDGVSCIQGTLYVQNFADSTLSLPDLETVLHLTIYDNDSLTAIELDKLTVTEGLFIGSNPLLSTVSLPAFEETFAFTAWDNTVLTSVSLPALATVTGELYLGSDPLLTSVTLGPVTSVRGLQLYRNDALSDLTPFSGITVVEDLFGIAHCPAVTSLSAFSNLTEMGRLFVEDMSMADFSGFEGITGEIGHLDIRDNPGITSLTGLGGITKTSQVYIAHNDTLASVGELSSLNEVTGDFEISGNTVLPTCAAEALRDQVLAGGGIGGNVDISLNDDGGTCSR